MAGVIIYCRKSRDDGYGKFDRIETQRDILVAYRKKNNLGPIIKVILDDNISGTDFTRLEIVKAMILQNRADILLCKDSSRLGRNMLEALHFAAFMKENNAQIIFVDENNDEDFYPLQAWFNERRAKEDSLKIRKTLQHRMAEKGVVTRAPYGYTKYGKGLAVDIYPSYVVKSIFMLYIGGLRSAEIGKRLNALEIPTPGAYLNISAARFQAQGQWDSKKIDHILANPCYCGDLISSVYTRRSYKDRRIIKKKPEHQIKITDHHPPIVSRQTFETASAMAGIPRQRPSARLFSGLLVCGGCGEKMYGVKLQGEIYYICSGYKNGAGPVRCTMHKVAEPVVIAGANNYIEALFTNPAVIQALEKRGKEQFQADVSQVDEEIQKLIKKVQITAHDYQTGIISDGLYRNKTTELHTNLNICRCYKDVMAQGHCNPGDIAAGKASAICSYFVERKLMDILFSSIFYFEPGELGEESFHGLSITWGESQLLQKEGGFLYAPNFSLQQI